MEIVYIESYGMKEVDIEVLKRIAEIEDNLDPASLQAKLGWRSRDVGLWPGTLTRLRMESYLKDVYESNSYHGYRLSEKARGVLTKGEPSHNETTQDGKPEVPEGIFEDIIGHEDVKELLKACLASEKPVHVLLTGPPALAKSLFLWDIERLFGERAIWLVGSAASRAGLWDLVAERKPCIILIDELDKMHITDMAALLSIMEGGRLVRAKKGRELNMRLGLTVVAATNIEGKLSPELRSRFAIRRLRSYSRDEFRRVVTEVLARRENIDPATAEKIAERLDGRTQDVRDAVRVARLTPTLGINRAIELLLRG